MQNVNEHRNTSTIMNNWYDRKTEQPKEVCTKPKFTSQIQGLNAGDAEE